MIRRPLLYGAVFVMIPVIIIDLFGKETVMVSGLFLWLISLLPNDNKIKKLCMLCAVFYSLGVVAILLHCDNTIAIDKYVGKQVSLNGEVLECHLKDKESDSTHISIEMRQKTYGRTRLIINSYNQNSFAIIPGDLIEVKGLLEEPAGCRNPNTFDYNKFLASVDIHHIMNNPQVTVRENSRTLNGRLYRLKLNYLVRLRGATDDSTAAFIGGILFGDKSMIDEEILEEFQRNGTAHILAVSGLHIGIIYCLISRSWLWRKGYTYLVFNGLFLLCYCMLASFSPSVVRASIMVIVHCLAKITNRKYDLPSAAFAILTVMIVTNPECIYNPGLQMSFLAVMSMTLIIPYIKKYYDGIISGSIAIQIGLLPYTMYVFNYLPLGAFVVNVPIVMIMGVLVPVALLSFVLQCPLYVLSLLVKATISFNSITCIEGATSFNVTSPPIFLIVLFYLFMLVFLTEQGRLIRGRIGWRFTFAGVVTIILIAAVFSMNMMSGFENADITFVDVGQGNCIHIKTEDRRNYLIDGGGSQEYNVGKKVLRPYLLKNGVGHIDAAIVTHLHSDHYKGVVELCRQGLVRRLFVYEGNRVNESEIIKDTGLKAQEISYIKAGDKLQLGNNCEVTCLWPKSRGSVLVDDKDENSNSLILRVDCDGMRVIVTGDVDSSCEDELAIINGGGCRADILSAAHHGSRYSWSDRFARIVSPKYVIFQVGKNNYGHPSKEAISGYEKNGAVIYRNDIQGAVGFEIDKGRVQSIHTGRDTKTYHNHYP